MIFLTNDIKRTQIYEYQKGNNFLCDLWRIIGSMPPLDPDHLNYQIPNTILYVTLSI